MKRSEEVKSGTQRNILVRKLHLVHYLPPQENNRHCKDIEEQVYFVVESIRLANGELYVTIF